MSGAAARRWAAVSLVCLATVLVGWWSKARCLDGGWTAGEQYLEWCYTDVYPLWYAERLDAGAVPYLDHPVEYPVLTGAQMWAAAQAAQRFPPPARARVFYHVTAALGAVFAVGVLALLGWAGLGPARAAWWAAAPTLAAYAFLNWDPAAVFLLTLAVVLHLRGHDGWAGVAAGLGAAAKLFPAVVVPVVVAARLAQRAPRAALAHMAAAAASWTLVNLPVAMLAWEGWWHFFALNRARPANWDSLWYFAGRVLGLRVSLPALNLWSAVLLLTGAAVIVAVGTRKSPPERWWRLVLPLLCWFLLVNKVYSPQYSLWLLPLMALALPRAAPFAAFLAADLMVFATEFPFLAGVDQGTAAPGYGVLAFALLARAGVLAWVVGLCLVTDAGAYDGPPRLRAAPPRRGGRPLRAQRVAQGPDLSLRRAG
ncbi:MAG TPA: glycosyltransferase 87 family protein [Egibacteraceae bacterium]|nr:glycosyltransferase 87 family protein [Egibacteraceae bacterium]